MFILFGIISSTQISTIIATRLPQLRTTAFQAIERELMNQTPNEKTMNSNLAFLRATKGISFAPPLNREYFQGLIVNGQANVQILQRRAAQIQKLPAAEQGDLLTIVQNGIRNQNKLVELSREFMP